ncbi:amidohydrolase family protein [Aquincola sp. S2]|uniref:Amidohydrolase family protein n=1 Tax=Pseudaquabacterium terrae TaxID=2732868 RepID=A0ABX2E9P5_9BURK|nr:amidohydrolase family protein [Aquabacterium terrae]NRF65736.1 amidohydrolase family protein [Aquabacterium terrae]
MNRSDSPFRRRALLVAALLAATAAAQAADAAVTVLRAQRLYVAPDAVPIDDAVVLIEGGKISAVGARAALTVPAGARESSCSGGVVTAGFQNSHVHFTSPVYAGSDTAAQAQALAAMLTRYGFTTVLDAASDPRTTIALRRRIESGAVAGPRILTAGTGLYPPNGIPFYLASLPKAVLEQLPQPPTAEAAQQVVRFNLEAGADATKLFIATPQADRSTKLMPGEVARAAADETHKRGKLVLAHPTNIDGLRAALAAGVDILAHTTLTPEGAWPEALVAQLVAQRVALVPTLKLWGFELAKAGVPAPVQQKLIGSAQAQLKGFAAAGGQVLFGTDVGYMTDFDPADEYSLMAGAGLTPMQILASLTTAPAARWNESARRGRVAAGLDADLVVLDGDPGADVRRFAQARCTIRGGMPLHPR